MFEELPAWGYEEAVPYLLSEAHWAYFHDSGVVDLGQCLSESEAAELAEDVAAGPAVDMAERLVDGSGRGLLEMAQHPVVFEAADRLFGPNSALSIASLRVGRPGGGTGDWEQPISGLAELDLGELATIVICLRPPALSETFLEVRRRSQLGGPGPLGWRATQADGRWADASSQIRTEPVEARAGQAFLLHRWLWHRWPVRGTRGSESAPDATRVATLRLAAGGTRDQRTGYAHRPMLRGERPSDPYPCVARLEADYAALYEHFQRAQAYALSLEAERDARRRDGN